jgi:probable F420-dependent oxidoreductase
MLRSYEVLLMSDQMKLGLFSINSGPCSWPEGALHIALLAEELGYESLWAGEHVVVPSPQVPPSRVAPTLRILDPLVDLAYVAGVTRHIQLGTGIVIVPQRQPAVLAKQAASLDVLSNGRLILGIGVGYVEREFEALGVPFIDRGARADEYLDAMRALWTMEQPAYHGRYVDFEGIDAYPRPVQPDGPRIVVGGNSPVAYRRAVTLAHGWYGFLLTPDQTALAIDGLRQAATEVERPPHLGDIEITVSPRGRIDRAFVERYGELGVHRLVLLPPGDVDLDGLAAFVGRHSPAELVVS